MHLGQFTGLIPASFEATGIEDGVEVKGTINIKLNRLAFKTVTEDGFVDAMQKADKDPTVIGMLLAGKSDTEPGLLAWWEMFTDGSQTDMLPITCENIISLPFDFVTALSEAVMDKLFQGPVKAGNSPDGSAATESTNSAATPDSPATPLALVDDTTSPKRAASGE